jgi:hypothetical protein
VGADETLGDVCDDRTTEMKSSHSNKQRSAGMKHKHKPGCRCANCLGEFDQRENAAQQLYTLLNLQWVGIRAAVAYADFARSGIEEAFPQQARASLGLLRKHNPGLLDNLLSDILD